MFFIAEIYYSFCKMLQKYLLQDVFYIQNIPKTLLKYFLIVGVSSPPHGGGSLIKRIAIKQTLSMSR